MTRMIAASVVWLLAIPAAGQGPLKVAVLEFEPALGETRANVERLLTDVETAMKKGARLVVTPEMATSGYHFDTRKQIEAHVETIPGPTTDAIARLAGKHDAYVVVSLPERDRTTGLYYISAALVGPKGWIGTYRKSHPWQQEEFWAARGDLGIPVFDTPIGRISMLICMDIVFAETGAVARKRGADILVVPTNSTAQTVSLMQGIALQNRMFVVGANRAGMEKSTRMPGASGVWAPDGTVLARTSISKRSGGTTRFLFAELNLDLAADKTAKAPSVAVPQLATFAPMNPNRTDDSRLGPVDAVSVQFEPSHGNVADNTDRIIQVLRRTKRGKNPLVVVFPELAMTGAVKREALPELVRESGEQLKRIAKVAHRRSTHVVVGTVRKGENGFHNTVAIIDGVENTLQYRDKVLHGPHDRHWATAGTLTPPAGLSGVGRVAILVGEDARSAELVASAAVWRADLLAIAESASAGETALVSMPKGLTKGDYSSGANAHWDVAARFSQTPTIAANWAGPEFGAGSGIYGIDPIYGLDSTEATDSHAPGVIRTTVKRQRYRAWWFNQQHLITLRRPELYRVLTH